MPALPAGLVYEQVDASPYNSAALRSDGAVVVWGDNANRQANVPPPPTGRRYVEVRSGGRHTMARLDAGTIVTAGANGNGQRTVPTLPAGVYYTGMAAGFSHSAARRSDGQIALWGSNRDAQLDLPTVATIGTCNDIHIGYRITIARRGPTSSYVQLGRGCAGSLPVSFRSTRRALGKSCAPRSSTCRSISQCSPLAARQRHRRAAHCLAT